MCVVCVYPSVECAVDTSDLLRRYLFFKRKCPSTFTATTETPHGKLWSLIAAVPDFILTGDAEDDVDVGREEVDEVAAAAAATRPPAML